MTEPLQKAIRNSALWAAYGDALGFISELTDESGLRRRAKTTRIVTAIPWVRQIGGRFGAVVNMPAGTYSDDTQLRFATSRAIRGNGKFDVEAFAKIELPVWRGYALGAGRGTKTAAGRLVQPDVNWFSNFFSDPVNYIETGGNGAAMRVQPHVWATNDWFGQKLIRDVLKNAICTHGHPRGIVGAVFHAYCLAFTLEKQRVPNPDDWVRLLRSSEQIIDTFHEDGDLAAFWIPTWESRTKLTLAHGFHDVFEECAKWIEMAGRVLYRRDSDLDRDETYKILVAEMGGLSESRRGTGTTTAIIAAALAWIFRKDPFRGIEAAANLMNSDTDTIATMAGALLGATASTPPNASIQDQRYIELEAERLYKISQGLPTNSFPYPDLMTWKPPKTQIETIIQTKTGFEVSALGKAEPIGSEFSPRGKVDYVFQWMNLSFGQTVLTKRRAVTQAPKQIKHGLNVSAVSEARKPAPDSQTQLFSSESRSATKVSSATLLDERTTEAIRSGFVVDIIGQHILELASMPDGIELVIGYAAIIAKARRAREVNGKHRS